MRAGGISPRLTHIETACGCLIPHSLATFVGPPRASITVFTSMRYCNHAYATAVNHDFSTSSNNGYMQGNRIRELRRLKKLTQQQVADYCGVSRVAVAKWESGDTENLKPPHLFKLARLFGVNPEEIALGTGPMRPTEPVPPALPATISDMLAGLEERIGAQPEAVRRAIAGLVAEYLVKPEGEREPLAQAIERMIGPRR